MAINAEMFMRYVEVIGERLEVLQVTYTSCSINVDGKVRWPAPWVEAMSESGEFPEALEKLIPMQPEELAPMTKELKTLARRVGLPLYEGKAEHNPIKKDEAKKDDRPRRRCPRCGEWMQPRGSRNLREVIASNPLAALTSLSKLAQQRDEAPLACKNCDR